MFVRAVGVVLIQRPCPQIVAKNRIVQYPIQPSVFMCLEICFAQLHTRCTLADKTHAVADC